MNNKSDSPRRIDLSNSEKRMYNLWLKTRWFIPLVMLVIGILRIGEVGRSYPITPLVVGLIGITLLNILFYLQSLKPVMLVKIIQTVLDIVFATLVVHLTGGIESSFVWVYLIAVVTASLTFGKYGGFISAVISSVCLIILILGYNTGILLPVNKILKADISFQIIFLISYIGLFAGIAFIISSISYIMKKVSSQSSNLEGKIDSQKSKALEKQKLIEKDEEQLKKYQEIVDVAASIVGIDHDINNQLTVFSLSVTRLRRAGEEYKDEKLSKTAEQMNNSLENIKKILSRLQDLKQLELIKEKRTQ